MRTEPKSCALSKSDVSEARNPVDGISSEKKMSRPTHTVYIVRHLRRAVQIITGSPPQHTLYNADVMNVRQLITSPHSSARNLLYFDEFPRLPYPVLSCGTGIWTEITRTAPAT